MYGERGALKVRWDALGLGAEHIFFTDGEQAEVLA
jgi:hypothetical protein